MPPGKRITAVEVPREKFWKFRDILDSGILGHVARVAISTGVGGVAYVLSDHNQEVALRVIGGVYFVSVALPKMIRRAKKKAKEE